MTNDTKKDLLNNQINQTPINDTLFLGKKRLLQKPMLLQDINHSSILSPQNIQFNDFKGYDRVLFQKIRHEPELIYNNNSIFNKIQLNNSPPFLNSIETENKLNNYYNYIYNLNYSLIGNELNNSIFNNYKKEKNTQIINYSINEIANYIVNDKSKGTSNNKSIFVDKKSLKNKNIFKVIYDKKKEPIIKKKSNLNNLENNNEIKIYKNNKVVYANTSLLRSYSTSKNIKQLNKVYFVKRNKRKRGSIYRGVSKNGNQWQVLMKENKNKTYKGSYPSEELAARIYDVLAFKNKRLKARTNFKYSSKQIKKICETEIDIKAKDIYDKIKQLIS